MRRLLRPRHPVGGPVVVALLAATLLAGVAWVAEQQADGTVRRQAERQVRSNADAAARALEHQSGDFRRAVAGFAADPAVVAALTSTRPQARAAAETALVALGESLDAPSVFVSDLQARAVAIYPAQPDRLGVSFAYRDWFKGAARTGAPYVSEAYRSAASGHPLVVGVAAPVTSGSRRVGYVTALWQLQSVRAVAEGARRDDGMTVTVTDQRGQTLTDALAVDDRGQAEPRRVSDLTRQALAGRTVSAVRDHRLVTARPVPGSGWTVQASVPESLALAPAAAFRRSMLETLGLGLLLILGFTGLSVRVARDRAAEEAAAEQERDRLSTLLASSPIGIVESQPDGSLLAVNDAFCTMLGYDPQELLRTGGPAYDRPDGAAADPVRAVLQGSAASGTEERTYRAKDGTAVPVLVAVVAQRDAAGQPRRLVTFVVDQRAQKAAADAMRALADELSGREAFLATLLDTMDVSVLSCDALGRLTLVNRQVRAMHGLDDEAPVADLDELRLARLDGTPLALEQYPLARALKEGQVGDEELLVLPRDGRPPVRVVARARTLRGADGGVSGAVVAAHDVTALRAGEAALRASEERFRRVFDEGLTGKLLVGTDGRVVRANATICRLLDRAPDELVGRPVVSFLDDPADRTEVAERVLAEQGELRAELAVGAEDGRSLWALVAMAWMTEEGGDRLLLVQVEDVTARRQAEQRLTELALHDELTGLPNRRLLLERCEHAFDAARSGRRGSSVAALFIDLDGFKAVNDRAGHEAGDRLLREVAHDLLTTLRPTDTVARVGGDEFVVLVEEDDGLGYLRTVADRVGTTVRRQVVVGSDTLPVSASVGIARVDLAIEPEVDPEQLLRRADAAMYRAKGRGPDRHDVYDVDLREGIEARRDLEREVREALASDRVEVVFQPVVEVDSGVVLGAETLLRVRTETGRLLPTLPTVVAAEAAGLAERLGDRVLDLALAAASRWPEHLSVAVNISARELTGRDLRDRVEAALARHAFDARRLVLEITESAVLHAGPSALAELERLRSKGVRVALDDFGTAYANLQNLTTLPVDALKVDSSFTAGLPGKRAHTAVVHGIASMAFELDIPCVVEGVETPAQLAALRGMSVHAQGWLWGQPTTADQVPGVQVVDLQDR